MDEKLTQALKDYVATANSGRYNSWEEINQKFPELTNYAPEILQDYVATYNSGKYDSWDTLNSKFPEFSAPVQPEELGKQDEVSGQGSQNTSSTSTEPSGTSQAGSINPETGLYVEGYSPDLDTHFKNMEEISITGTKSKSSFVDNLVNNLRFSSASLGEMWASIPEYLYSLGTIPQNLIADAIENNAGSNVVSDYLRVDTQQGFETVSQGQYNPLRLIRNIADYYATDMQMAEANFRTYENSITENLTEGNLLEVGEQAFDEFVRSTGAIMSMMATGGATTVGRGVLTTLPFASAEYQELSENPNINQNLAPVYSALKGGAEVIFERSDKISGDIVSGLIGTREVKGLLEGFTRKALSANGIPASIVNGGISEGATTLSQEIVDVISGVKEQIDYGAVLDATVTGSIIDGGLGSVRNVADAVVRPSNSTRVRELQTQIEQELQDINNPNLSDTTVDNLRESISEKVQEIDNIVNSDNINNLPDEQRNRVVELNTEVDNINADLESSEISDSTRESLENRKTAINEELESIVETSTPDVVEDSQVAPVGTEVEQAQELVTPENRQALQSSYDRLTEGMTESQIEADPDLVRMRNRLASVQETETPTETEQSEIVNELSSNQNFLTRLNDSAQRSTRIQELEQRLRDNIRQAGNLGIAQDGEQQARQNIEFIRDLTEYAVLRIADGTIKTANALADALSIPRGDVNVQQAFDNAQQINTIIQESTVTPRRQTVKGNIRQATQGGIQGRENITSRQALSNQMRTLNRGARDMAKNTRDLAGTISAYIQSQKGRLKGAKVSQTVVNRVANAVSGVTNEAQLSRALNTVEKYINDAEFRTKLNNVASQQRSLRRAANQMPADRRGVIREFTDINPIDLSPEKLDSYLNILQSAQRVAFANVGEVTNEQLRSYVDEAKLWEDKRTAERALNAELRESSPEYQERRLEAKKEQLKELGLSESEINELIDPNKDFREVLADLESERRELTPTRAEVLRNNAERLAEVIKSNRVDIRKSLNNNSDKKLFDLLVKNLDISNLSDRKLLSTNYILHNIAVEGSMVGSMDLISSLDSANRLKSNLDFLADAFRDVGVKMWNYLNSRIFGAQGRLKIEAITKDSSTAGRLNNVTGFQNYVRSAVRAVNKMKSVTKASDKITSKHKGKWSDVGDKIKMSMYIVTSQYRESWTPEEVQSNYVGRWKAIAESYDRLVNDPSTFNRKVNAALAERLKTFIQEDSSNETNPNALVRVVRDAETGRISEVIPLVTSEQLYNQLPAQYKEYYNFTRRFFDVNKEDFFSIREASDNKVLEKDWVNYYPISYTTFNNKAGTSTASRATNTIDLRDSPTRGKRSITGETSGSGNDRTLIGDRLPVGQVFNFQMLDSFLEDAGRMVFDVETTLDKWVVNETTDFRKNGLAEAFEGTDNHIGAMEHYRVVVADKIQADEFNLQLPTLNANYTLSQRMGRQMLNSIRNIGASKALGSLMGAQRLKQTTPLVETIARLRNKQSFVTAIQLIMKKDPRVANLLEESSVSLRNITDTHLGLQSVSRGVSEREYNSLTTMAINGVEGFERLTTRLSEFSLKELQNSDVDYATIGWLSMYIDKATEGNQPLNLDVVNDNAFGFAEQQNEVIMNSSDRAMQGNYSKNEFLKAIAPMMSFSMNTTNSLIISLDRLMYYRRQGDMAKARYYAKEASANFANAALFQAISTSIRVGGLVGVKFAGQMAYDVLLNWFEDDDEDEFKAARIARLNEGSTEFNEQMDKAIQRSLLNSGGYLINDMLTRGLLFGDAGSEMGGFLAGTIYEQTLGQDYLDRVEWKPMMGFSESGLAGAAGQLAGLTGIFGMGVTAIADVAKDFGAVAETQEDFLQARRGFANAEGTEILVDDFDLTEEGLIEYGKPLLAEQSEFLSLSLSTIAMLGLSDQVLNSFSRGIRASTKKTLNEIYGRGKSEAQLKKILREVSDFNEITNFGVTYTPTPKELGDLKATYLNNVAYYRRSLGSTIPLKSIQEETIMNAARSKTLQEFYTKYPHVRKVITKEAEEEAKKKRREGELKIKSIKFEQNKKAK